MSAATKPQLRIDRNAYAAQCLDCGAMFPPGSGFLYEGKVDGFWKICCDSCFAMAEPNKPKSRTEQRKAAWRLFRKSMTKWVKDDYCDRPPWKDFLAIWAQCK